MEKTLCLLVTNGVAQDGVRRYDFNSGAFIDVFASTEGGVLHLPTALALGADGDVFVANMPIYAGNNVLRYRSSGAFVAELPSAVATGLAYFGVPDGIACGPDGNLYVGKAMDVTLAGAIARYQGSTGDFIDWAVPLGSSELKAPSNLCFGPDGDLYVWEFDGDSILRYDTRRQPFAPKGAFIRHGAFGRNIFNGLSFGPDGDLFVSSRSHKVLRYAGTSGAFLGEFVANAGKELANAAGLRFGPDGNLYVCSYGNNSVLRYDNQGVFKDSFVAGLGGFAFDLLIAEMALPDPFSIAQSCRDPVRRQARRPRSRQVPSRSHPAPSAAVPDVGHARGADH